MCECRLLALPVRLGSIRFRVGGRVLVAIFGIMALIFGYKLLLKKPWEIVLVYTTRLTVTFKWAETKSMDKPGEEEGSVSCEWVCARMHYTHLLLTHTHTLTHSVSQSALLSLSSPTTSSFIRQDQGFFARLGGVDHITILRILSITFF